MKRWICALAVLALLLSGCGASQTKEPAPELILRYADNQAEDYPTVQAAEYFAQLVRQRTQGRILIRVCAGGELGGESSVIEQIRFGGIDMARVSVGTLAETLPEVGILQLPYLYDDAYHMWRVLDGPIGEDFMARIRKAGMVGLSWFDAGARSFYTRQEISSLEELSGLTIRVQESEFMSRLVTLLGAVPVQITYEDVYSALQTGKIDGAENNWPSYETTGHFEAAPYYLLDEHSRLPELQIMSTVALDRIAEVDEDYVRIVQNCAREAGLYERRLWKEQEQSSEALVRSLGCEVTSLSEGELAKFRQAVQPMYEDYSQELIASIRAS